MGRYTKRIITGLAAVSLLVGGASADFLAADFDDGNKSKMDTYFYVYSSRKGPDDLAALKNSGGEDRYGLVSYLSPGEGMAGGAGGLIVDPLIAHDEDNDYYPGWGMGISLTSADDVGLAGFKNVTAVKFYAKTTTPGVKVGFKIETEENAEGTLNKYGFGTYNTACDNVPGWGELCGSEASNAWFTLFEPTNEWTQFTIPITPTKAPDKVNVKIDAKITTGHVGPENGTYVMKQDGWWGYAFEFKPERATKIAWFINSNANAALADEAADVYIDSLVFVGTYEYVPEYHCETCVSSSFNVPTPNQLISTFEGDDFVQDDMDPDFLQNSRGYFWYYYDDKEGGGNSNVFDLIESSFSPTGWIIDAEGKGREGGNGAFISFAMGDLYDKGDVLGIEPFVGIGTNLYNDTTRSNYLNASAHNGIYFEYNTDAEFLFVELADSDDMKLQVDPYDGEEKAVGDIDGEVFFVRLPGTGGTWKSANIPFSAFKLWAWVHTNDDTRRKGDTAPKWGELGQIKFKRQGGARSEGSLAIDNVYFHGGSVNVRHIGNRTAKTSGLRATYNRGTVGVNFQSASQIKSGKISLVNIKGRTVASSKIKNVSGKISANLGAGRVPTGMYFVRVVAKDVNGKRVVQQAPISIVK